MESIFGIGNLAREAAITQMIQSYEKDIHEIARIDHLIKQSRPVRPAWYCPLLVRLGDWLVVFGTRLKARYAVQIRFDKNNLDVA